MVLFNYATKELTAKVVYYGPGLCGKTTNLQWVHEKLPIKNKGKMLSLATETDRTLFFDFLPIELGSIRGMKTRIQLYTVPGQVFYNATRRMVLKGADCVVFVADSQEPMLEANLESLKNLKENLEANEINPSEIPMVLQFNKRDLPNALPLEILNERMNERNHPFFEAVALKGIGVEETLKGATALVFRSLASKYGEAGSGTGLTGKISAETPSLPPTPVAAAMPARPQPAPAPAAPRPAPLPVPVPARPAPVPVAVAPILESLSAEDLLEPIDVEVGEPEPAGRSTMVHTESEVAELRRSLRNHESVPELEAETLDLDLEESLDPSIVDEVPLDAEPEPAPEPAPAPAPAFKSAPRIVPPAPQPPSRMPQPAWAVVQEPILQAEAEPEPRTPVRALPSSVVASPVSVEISAIEGSTQTGIPVEIQLQNGGAQIVLQLRLTLNLKLK
jgi:signal recognition particle receptor subunit beta